MKAVMKVLERTKISALGIGLLITSLLVFLYPASKLWSAITNAGSLEAQGGGTMSMDNIAAFSPEEFKSSGQADHYSSSHFELYISRGYMNHVEAEDYLDWIENRYETVIDYLQYGAVLSKSREKIDVFLLQSEGTSFCGGNYFVVYYHLEGLDVSVHEMTHSLDFKYAKSLVENSGQHVVNDYADILFRDDDLIHPDFINFYEEQRAVFIEDQFGAGVGFPNYGLPLNAIIFEELRSNRNLESFEDLNRKFMLMDEGNYELSTLRYTVAGSFAQFLIKTYGIDRHNLVMTRGYSGAYQKPISLLEQEWFSWLKVRSNIQTVFLLLACIAILVIGTLWLKLKSKTFWLWTATVVTGVLAFLSWGYYLGYNDNDLWGVVLALAAGALLKLWKTRIGIAALWLLGIITVILPFGLFLM